MAEYKPVDNAVGKLSRIQEYLDVGLSTTLEIALDIEEGNESGKTTAEIDPRIDQLKEITLEYVKMEKELKQWLRAAEMTKTAFQEEHRNAKGCVGFLIIRKNRKIRQAFEICIMPLWAA